MWSQFVFQGDKWIGGVLEDFSDYSEVPKYRTEITDIKLEPNGDKHAWFEVSGKDFNCGFCTTVGGVIGGEDGWITFSGYQGHTWRIKERQNKPAESTDPQLPL